MHSTNPTPLRRAMPLAAIAVVAGLGLLVAPAAQAEMHAGHHVTFTSYGDVATVDVGAQAPLEIEDYSLMASGHTYGFMVKVTAQDGKLRITPTREMEIGTYELTVNTNQDDYTVAVDAPLSDLESIVEKKADNLGITTEEARQRLGLYTTAPRAETWLELQRVYYEGTPITIEMGAGDDVVSSWLVNGETVLEGPGEDTLIYVPEGPGDYVISYREVAGDEISAEATAVTTVAPRPIIMVDATPAQKLVLKAPDGFGRYRWTIDGEYAGRGRSLSHTFSKPGAYEVLCTAFEEEGQKPESGYAAYRYQVAVN